MRNRNLSVGFGTVLGYHSVAELKDLVAAKDVAMRNLARRFAECEMKDLPLNYTQFLPAYQGLAGRYNAARELAQKAIDDAVSSLRSENMVVAENEYNGLLTSLNPRWQEHTWSSGDGSLEDLYAQVIDAGSTSETDESTPQPRPGSDYDFNVLTATTQATSAIESTSQLFDTKHLILYAVIGGAFALFVLPKLMTVSIPGSALLRR